MSVRSLALMLVLSAPAFAQPVKLGETVRPGDHFRYDLALTLDMKMKVDKDGKAHTLSRKGEAVHQFAERIEAADAGGAGGRAVRHYDTAKLTSTLAGDVSRLELPADRRLMLAVRTETGTMTVCPAGPLTREHLELAGEHFDTLAVPALLPNKELKAGETWAVGDAATQHACQFDGLVKHDLKGTLTAVKDGVATFTLAGKAEGVSQGAVVKTTVAATGTFDVKAERITALTWEETGERELGPASPAAEVKAVVRMTRTPLADEPKELSAEARAKVPADKIPAEMTRLTLADPDGKYTLVYPREWVVVVQQGEHTVLRLMTNGEFQTQATLTGWKKADKGSHTSAGEFKRVLAKLPGWEPGEVLADEEKPTSDGRWVYKLSAKGKQDGAEVVQTFYLMAGPNGDQVAATFLTAADKAGKLAEREAELLSGISFTGKK
jgi:hypothetical protein